MTDNEKQRVAEWCGWRWWCTTEAYRNDERCLYAPRHTPGPPEMFRLCEGDDLDLPIKQSNALPDYPNSLDTCAEFERVAKERDLMLMYIEVLIRLCRGTDQVEIRLTASYLKETLMVYASGVMEATPAQRVEAILRVIEETQP